MNVKQWHVAGMVTMAMVLFDCCRNITLQAFCVGDLWANLTVNLSVFKTC